MASAPEALPDQVAEGAGGPGPYGAHGRLGLGQLGAAHVALGLQPGRLALGVLERGQPGGALACRRP